MKLFLGLRQGASRRRLFVSYNLQTSVFFQSYHVECYSRRTRSYSSAVGLLVVAAAKPPEEPRRHPTPAVCDQKGCCVTRRLEPAWDRLSTWSELLAVHDYHWWSRVGADYLSVYFREPSSSGIRRDWQGFEASAHHVHELSVYPCLENGFSAGNSRLMLQVEGFSVNLYRRCSHAMTLASALCFWGPCLLLHLAQAFSTDVLVQYRLMEVSFERQWRVVMP